MLCRCDEGEFGFVLCERRAAPVAVRPALERRGRRMRLKVEENSLTVVKTCSLLTMSV